MDNRPSKRIITRNRPGRKDSLPYDLMIAIAHAKSFGETVRLWREYRNITPKQLAKDIGISTQYLSMIESGKRKGEHMVRKFMEVFDCEPDDLK